MIAYSYNTIVLIEAISQRKTNPVFAALAMRMLSQVVEAT